MSANSSAVSARRRVCASCQTSKRRCDQRLPRCSRCAQRNQQCIYPSLSASRELSTVQTSSIPLGSIPTTAEAPQLAPASFSVPLPHFTAVLPGASTIGPVPVITSSPDPWPLFFDAQGPANTAISRPAMDWGVSQLAMFPAQWVTNGICPFINPSLYTNPFPHTLRDAYTVCAAYSLKNQMNAGLVMGIVEAKAQSLLYDPEQINWTPIQQLAALQALVMYQLIQWFDGDIRQRALADVTEAVIDSWTEALQASVGQKLFERGQEGNLLAVPPPPEPGDTGASVNIGHQAPGGGEYAALETVKAWRQFLFAESCRRTIIFAYAMRGIYAMAKQGYCRIGNRVAQMSFTGSFAIWGADTASRWSTAWASEPHHWVEHMDFEPMLMSGRPEEVDSLSFLLAVTYKGPDVIEAWSMSTGAYMFTDQSYTDIGVGSGLI